MSTQNLNLGANELRLLFTLEKENKSIFSIKDAKKYFEPLMPPYGTLSTDSRKRRG